MAMTRPQCFILNIFLSDFDDTKSFEQTLDDIENDTDDVIVWVPFENMDRHQLAQTIADTANNLSDLIADMETT